MSIERDSVGSVIAHGRLTIGTPAKAEIQRQKLGEPPKNPSVSQVPDSGESGSEGVVISYVIGLNQAVTKVTLMGSPGPADKVAAALPLGTATSR